jgi:hypothetical protein
MISKMIVVVKDSLQRATGTEKEKAPSATGLQKAPSATGLQKATVDGAVVPKIQSLRTSRVYLLRQLQLPQRHLHLSRQLQ